MLAVRRKHAVKSRQIHARLRHRGDQSGDEVERLKDHMRGAIPIRRLQLVTDVAIRCQRQTLLPNSRSRKELREGSGGAGRQRGGLGQVIEISANPGHKIYINAMFDRCDNPARGRDGGHSGAAGAVSLDDGGSMQSKGK